MDRVWQILDGTSSAAGPFTPEAIILSLLLAFVLGQVLAWVYCFTHSGLSFSRSFVQSLILITVVVAMVMAVIGTSIITAVGLMGALAIIRFRNIIKDTRDVSFIFCSLVVGMASGSQRYGVAIVGTVILCLIAIYLYVTSFGTQEPHNGFLRFTSRGAILPDDAINEVLKHFCRTYVLISAQDSNLGDSEIEYAYQLMIRSSEKSQELLYELQNIEGISNINLTVQERLLEV